MCGYWAKLILIWVHLKWSTCDFEPGTCSGWAWLLWCRWVLFDFLPQRFGVKCYIVTLKHASHVKLDSNHLQLFTNAFQKFFIENSPEIFYRAKRTFFLICPTWNKTEALSSMSEHTSLRKFNFNNIFPRVDALLSNHMPFLIIKISCLYGMARYIDLGEKVNKHWSYLLKPLRAVHQLSDREVIDIRHLESSEYVSSFISNGFQFMIILSCPIRSVRAVGSRCHSKVCDGISHWTGLQM